MNILHTADWHLGKIVNEYSMLELQKEALEQIINISIMNNVDVLLIAGDVYDRSIPSADAMNLLDWFISKYISLGKKIIMMGGNHDSKSRLSFGSSIFKDNNLFIVSGIEPSKIVLGQTSFYVIPYTNLQELKMHYNMDFKNSEEAYKYMVDNIILDNNKSILMMHDYVTSGNLELSDSERPLSLGALDFIDYKIFNKFDYVALGHVHKGQKVGVENIRYSGSILKYSFSEVNHKKSVVLVNDNISLIPLRQSRNMVEIKGNLDEIINPDFYMKYNLDDYFKIILTDDKQVIDASAKLKGIFKNLMEIHYNKVDLNYRAINKDYKSKEFIELYHDFFNHVGYEVDDNDNNLINEVLKRVGDENENH